MTFERLFIFSCICATNALKNSESQIDNGQSVRVVLPAGVSNPAAAAVDAGDAPLQPDAGDRIKSLIVIGGGVGPAASVALQQKIVASTKATGDKDHVSCVHVSIPELVDDRTGYILGVDKNPNMPNPGRQMAQAVSSVNFRSAHRVILGVPCNTFHMPLIWKGFTDGVMEFQKASGAKIEFVHMLEGTANLIQQEFPKVRRVGLMSTTGTRSSRVYHDVLLKKFDEVVEVEEQFQEELHDTIYNKQMGLKAVTPASKTAVDNFHRYAEMIAKRGAEVAILGCTEIPLAFPGEISASGIPLVNPVTALTVGLIQAATGPEKLIEDASKAV